MKGALWNLTRYLEIQKMRVGLCVRVFWACASLSNWGGGKMQRQNLQRNLAAQNIWNKSAWLQNVAYHPPKSCTAVACLENPNPLK